jgi:hypothetical protein
MWIKTRALTKYQGQASISATISHLNIQSTNLMKLEQSFKIPAHQIIKVLSFEADWQILRKALTTRATAGFQQAVYKVAVIVQLLMGEIPERGIFRQPMLKKALAPYLEITSGLFLFL